MGHTDTKKKKKLAVINFSIERILVTMKKLTQDAKNTTLVAAELVQTN